ncbi:MAG: RHS repeat-associated core domain-containing protein, partial [Pseudomonadota bacterium]
GVANNDNVVAIAEIEAWTPPEGGGSQLQRFDAWGNKTQSAGANIPQYGYTGREPDGTGLIYYRARYYDPTIGRFISRDPAGMPDGVNRYAYVGNDPVNANDPSGLYGQFIAAAVETAPVWAPRLASFARSAWSATKSLAQATWSAVTTTVKTNPGVVAGTIGGTTGTAGYLATTPNPTVSGAATAGGVSAVQGVLSVYAPGAGTFLQGATIGGLGNAATQSINIASDPSKSFRSDFNLFELGGSMLGGAYATKLTGPFLPANAGWSQQAAAATISFPVQTGFSAVGQRLGAPSPEFALPNFNDFGSPSLDFPTFAGLSGGFDYLNFGGSAGGGFLLYPNKVTNMMRSVYAK